MGAKTSKTNDYSEDFCIYNDTTLMITIEYERKNINNNEDPMLHVFTIEKNTSRCIKIDSRFINTIDIYEQERKDKIHLFHVSNVSGLDSLRIFK